MFSKPLPRFVIAKRLASGSTGFYFHLPALYRKLGCPVPNEPLGTDYDVACGENGDGGRAAARNALFDEWNSARKGGQVTHQVARRLRHRRLAVSRVQGQQGLSGEGLASLTAGLRADDAAGHRHRHEEGRSDRRPAHPCDLAGERRQDLRHHLQRPAGSAAAPGREGRRPVPASLARRSPPASHISSTGTFRTLGKASPSSAGPRGPRPRSRGIRSMPSRGAASSTESRRLPLLR